jgi:LAO/AO transport system kinase
LSKSTLTLKDIFSGIRAGKIAMLSKAITLMESSLPEHRNMAADLVEMCLPFSGNSIRIGITGVPGAGKSTFIDSLGTFYCEQKQKVCVLAVDPSSQKTQGSILGDKTRMEKLSAHENAFIRPSPSAGSLGGVAKATRESIILCEAAGFTKVLVETVGVGQSETEVHSMVDFFLLLAIPGAGDELQGIKRGIMEMADAIIINKADGDNMGKVTIARGQLVNALHLFPLNESGWLSPVESCSALENTGIDKAAEIIEQFIKLHKQKNLFEKRRDSQSEFWLNNSIENMLKQGFFENKKISQKLSEYKAMLLKKEISPFKAANDLMALYSKEIKS